MPRASNVVVEVPPPSSKTVVSPIVELVLGDVVVGRREANSKELVLMLLPPNNKEVVSPMVEVVVGKNEVVGKSVEVDVKTLALRYCGG